MPTNAPPVMLTNATECAAVERLVLDDRRRQSRHFRNQRSHRSHHVRAEQTDQHACGRQYETGQHHGESDLVRLLGVLASRLTEKNDTESLREAGRGQASDQCESRDRQPASAHCWTPSSDTAPLKLAR